MGTNELIALAIVVVRETRKKNNHRNAILALREFKWERRDFTANGGTVSPELREADRAIRACETKLFRFV